MSERLNVNDLLLGVAKAQAVQVAATLGLADLLADGPRSSAALAHRTGTHEPSLSRLLRALMVFGVVTETAAGFELTEAGTVLRGDVPGSIRDLVLLCTGDEPWRAWGQLEHAVRTGETPFDRVTGQSWIDFFAQHEEQGATFNTAMSVNTRWLAPRLLDGYDFSRFGTVADIGGGDGTLVAALLNAVPGLRCVLYDLPAGLASAQDNLAGFGDRCELVAGSFFDAVPENADAYVLKSVLHDWDDERARKILTRCREAMSASARVLVIEPMLTTPCSPGKVTSDLNMMVITGGRERSEKDFRELFSAAGLEVDEVAGPFGGHWVVVGRT